jgi:thiol:disulfide interchange protein
MRQFYFVWLVLGLWLSSFGQVLKPISWKNSISGEKPSVGDTVVLKFTATIDKNWYLYSNDFDPDLGPMLTEFEFEKNETYELIGIPKPINPTKKFDEIWEGEVSIFKGTGIFEQQVKILSPEFFITGNYTYQVCSDIDGKCIPFEDSFSFGTTSKKKEDTLVNDNTTTDSDSGWWSLFILSFGAGLLALLMPCTYPLIPITVSVFLKQSNSRRQGITKAFAFGLSIIVLFSVIGFLFSLIWGVGSLNALSTNWILNVGLFLVFIAFALSFFGLFEMTLPSWLVNKIDRQADKGGWLGIFFMAFTLVVVSFSCTVPIVGAALVNALDGNVLSGGIAMLGFSLAFAIPFSLFAIFPTWLKTLPRSGSWMHSLKVVLGFLELALALKFLSVADLAYHWGVLDREIFLALWIAIFGILGFYLLGLVRLKSDGEFSGIGITRLFLSIITFSFVVYLIPGMWGAPLKGLAGFLPPMTTMDFNPYTSSQRESNVCETPKYADFLHLPLGLQGYFDLNQALDCAKVLDKPVFVDFTGHGCVNCREMEQRVWSDAQVLDILSKDYVVVALYVDDKTKLPESDWYESTNDGRMKKTIGQQNADLQITRWNNNAQPFYLLLNPNGELLLKPKAYDLSVSNFVNFLNEGLKNHRNGAFLPNR